MKNLEKEISYAETVVKRLKPCAWIFIAFGVICALYPFFRFDIRMLKYNEYGDYVGGPVAALLTVASMIFIYIAYLTQKHQILIQQQEIEEYKIHSYFTQFEARFFQLLGLHTSSVNLMDYRDKAGKELSVGKDCFRTYFRSLEKAIRKLQKQKFIRSNRRSKKDSVDISEYENVDLTLEEVADEFIFIYGDFQSDLDPYYRRLEHLIRYIHNSTLRIEQKEEYFEIVRTQLSTYELVFVYYFIHLGGDFSKRQLSKLAKAYNLLRDVDEILLFHGDKSIHF